MNQLREWLDMPVIDIRQAQCLNYKSSQAVCKRCVDICPTKALELHDRSVKLIDKKCNDCTACIAACPTLAVEYVPKPYTKIINEITAYPQVNITCNVFEKLQKGIKIPCYRTIDPAMIAHFATVNRKQQIEGSKQAGGGIQAVYTLNLYTGECPGCKYHNVFDIHQHIENLRQWCSQVGLPVEIHATDDAEFFLDKEDDVVSGVTRRSLLKNLRLRKAESVEQETEITADPLTYSQRNNYKRLKIKQAMGSFKQEITSTQRDIQRSLPEKEFSTLTFQGTCDKCGVCEAVCPTKALLWESKEDRAALMFDPQKCIACGRCEICPQQSLKIQPISVAAYYDVSLVNIVELPTKKCSDCGSTFFVGDARETEQTLCHLCQIKAEKTRALLDSL